MRQKEKWITVLMASLMLMFAANGYAEDIQPRGMRIKEQSFKANFKNFKKVFFASYDDSEDGSGKLHFYLMRNDKVIYAFPDYPLSYHGWSFYEMKAVSFKDVNGDGLKDVIVIADYMTGIGPTGARPFPVNGVYLQAKDKFVVDEAMNEKLNNRENYEKLKSIRDIVKFLRSNQ